jgi:hypothetical protein
MAIDKITHDKNEDCSLPSDVHFKLIDDLFPNTDINEVHHHLFCINRNCTGFSKAEKNRQSHLKEKKTITISNMNSQLSHTNTLIAALHLLSCNATFKHEYNIIHYLDSMLKMAPSHVQMKI